MKLTEIKQIISQVIAEAKENGALPKSGGKLVHLKKELSGLKKMQESVGQLALTESDNDALVAEYAHMQKYINDYNKIKEASAKLSERLGAQIDEVENKIQAETQKIKELMGLIEPALKKEAKKSKKKEDPKDKESKEETMNEINSVLKKVLKKEGKEQPINEVDMQEILPALIASGLLSVGAISAIKQAIKNPKKFVDDVRNQGKLPSKLG